MKKTLLVSVLSFLVASAFGQTITGFSFAPSPTISVSSHAGDGGNLSSVSPVSGGYQVSTTSFASWTGADPVLPGQTATGNYSQGGSIAWILTVTASSASMPTSTTVNWTGAFSGNLQFDASAENGNSGTGIATNDGATYTANAAPGSSNPTTKSLPPVLGGSATLGTWINTGASTWQATAILRTDTVNTQGLYKFYIGVRASGTASTVDQLSLAGPISLG